MAVKIVQNVGVVSALTGYATTSRPIALKSGYLRLSTENNGVHVAIGTNPVATPDSFHIPPYSNEIIKETLKKQAIAGITTGTTTTVDFGKSNGNYFEVGDFVSIEGCSPVGINTYASISSVSTNAVILNYNSSSVTNVVVNPGACLSKTVRVSTLGNRNNTEVNICEVVILVTE
jgi:hypothetical protein